MIGGDEVGAVVVDVGAHTTRAGYAGEDVPRAVFRSVVCRCGDATHVGTGALAVVRDGQTVHPVRAFVDTPTACGTAVRDRDALQAIVRYALAGALGVDAADHPLLFTEPIAQPRAERAALAELCFEQHGAPAFFLSKTNVLAAFAAAKATALVVDVGAEALTVAPVHEGFSLRTAAVASPVAGNHVTAALLEYVEHDKHANVQPRYELRKKQPVPAPSYRAFCVNVCCTSCVWMRADTAHADQEVVEQEVVDDMKHSVMRITQPTAPGTFAAITHNTAHTKADGATHPQHTSQQGQGVSSSKQRRHSRRDVLLAGWQRGCVHRRGARKRVQPVLWRRAHARGRSKAAASRQQHGSGACDRVRGAV